ncbi:hypothetical protein D3C72_1093930 [compost metagenome]
MREQAFQHLIVIQKEVIHPSAIDLKLMVYPRRLCHQICFMARTRWGTGISNNHQLPSDNHAIDDMRIQHIKLGPLIGRHRRAGLQRLIGLCLGIDEATCLGHSRTSRIFLVADAIPAAGHVTARATIEALLPRVGGLDAAIVELHYFHRHASIGALGVVGDDHFFENDFVVLELFGTGPAHHQLHFLQVLAGTAGFEQLAAGAVQVLGEGEVGERGTPGRCATCRACGGRSALVGTELVADDFDSVGVLLVQCFASDFRDLNISIESHAYLSLVKIGLITTVFGHRRLEVVPEGEWRIALRAFRCD